MGASEFESKLLKGDCVVPVSGILAHISLPEKVGTPGTTVPDEQVGQRNSLNEMKGVGETK